MERGGNSFQLRKGSRQAPPVATPKIVSPASNWNEDAIAALHELRMLPAPRFEETQWDVLNALILLLPLAVDQLRRVFQEEGGVDFIEIAIGARYALGTDAAPTDLSNALDCQVQHLLIDEFQDTSQSQYDLLYGLIRDWRPRRRTDIVPGWRSHAVDLRLSRGGGGTLSAGPGRTESAPSG